MTDVLGQLPRFSWRGIEYPLTERSASFAHDNVEHRIEYRSGDLIEMVGARNLTFRYSIPMREDIAKGPYRSLFVTGLAQLFNDCRDRTPGPLVDPVLATILGTLQCVPALYEDSTDPQKRDGADVRVEFTHAPDLDDASAAEPSSTLAGVVGDAQALDAEIATVDWKQLPSPEPSVDILDAINGAGAQGLAQVGKFSAALDDLAFKLEKIDQTADQLENPQVWPLKRSARRNRDIALQLKKRAQDPFSRIVTVTTRYAKTISVIASEAGMTVQELLKVNPSIARTPLVPAGSTILIVQKVA